jgi:putative transposase
VTYGFIRAEQAFPVAIQCAVLNVSRSGFYAYCNEPQTAREVRDAPPLRKDREEFAASQAADGIPRVTVQLQLNGIHVSKGDVERSMHDKDIRPKNAQKLIATTDSAHDCKQTPKSAEFWRGQGVPKFRSSRRSFALRHFP